MLQLEIPFDVVAQTSQQAQRRGWDVVLNAAPADRRVRDILPHVDTLVMNEVEAFQLFDRQVVTPSDGLSAARLGVERGARMAIVTLGAAGAAFCERGSNPQLITGFQVSAVDATAAGDAFVGAIAVARSRGRAASEAVVFANAAGALATTKPGAQASLPTLSEVQRLA